jgi:hypothetical protein
MVAIATYYDTTLSAGNPGLVTRPFVCPSFRVGSAAPLTGDFLLAPPIH